MLYLKIFEESSQSPLACCSNLYKQAATQFKTEVSWTFYPGWYLPNLVVTDNMLGADSHPGSHNWRAAWWRAASVSLRFFGQCRDFRMVPSVEIIEPTEFHGISFHD